MKNMRNAFLIILGGVVLLGALWFWSPARMETRVYFHESYIGELGSGVALQDADQVFSFIFDKLPKSVKVYPTENYYYFKFWADGKEIWGNIRLAVGERDEGLLSFAYWEFNNLPEMLDSEKFFSNYKQFSAGDGLKISRKSPLVYEVSWRGKTVNFNLNQIVQTAPRNTVKDGETFLMRTFDESGMPFVLVFNEKTKDFRWILDESTAVPEDFLAIKEKILIGKRTQFVFYDDGGRKVLIGVLAGNINRNNYFDGPFDQLADNYIETIKQESPATNLKNMEGGIPLGRDNKTINREVGSWKFRDYLERAYSYTKGQIDDYGYFGNSDGTRSGTRVAITPYYAYSSASDLAGFIDGCTRGVVMDLACLTHDFKKDYKR